MLLFAILVGLTLYGLAAPDPVTLRTTRGAAGAIRSMPAPTRSTSPRSTSPRSTSPRSTSPRSTRGATRPTRSGRPARSSNPPRSPRSARTRSTPDPPRPISLIARVIRGGLDASDRAVRRRGEAVAAVGEVRARVHARRAARDLAEAEDQAHAENERRDRAEQRARPIPAPPAAIPPPTRPTNGAHVDKTPIPTTELQTLDQFNAEVSGAFTSAGQIGDAVRELSTWLLNLRERYTGAANLYKTGQMNAAVMLLAENYLGGMQNELTNIASRLDLLLKGIEKAKADAQESDAQTGRVESAVG